MLPKWRSRRISANQKARGLSQQYIDQPKLIQPFIFFTTLFTGVRVDRMLQSPMVNPVVLSTTIFAAWITTFEYEFVMTFIFMRFESSVVNKDLATVIVIAWKLIDQLIINRFGVFESFFFQFDMIVHMEFHHFYRFINFEQTRSDDKNKSNFKFFSKLKFFTFFFMIQLLNLMLNFSMDVRKL